MHRINYLQVLGVTQIACTYFVPFEDTPRFHVILLILS